MAHSGPTAVAHFLNSASAVMLSTKAQLTHMPAHRAIVHGIRGRGHHVLSLGRTHTQMQSLILASFFSPIPDTRIRSSTEAKAPFFVRSSIIDWAMEGPMPESVCSSSALAVLIFTRLVAPLRPMMRKPHHQHRLPQWTPAAPLPLERKSSVHRRP